MAVPASDAKTAFGSEQLNCLNALTALRIAYQSREKSINKGKSIENKTSQR